MKNLWDSIEDNRIHLLNIAKKLAPRYGVLMVDVDDIVQETMLDAWKHLQNYSEERGRIITWLTLLLRSNMIDACRKNTAYLRKMHIYSKNREYEILRDLSIPDSEVITGDLSSIQQSIIELVANGWTIEDISKITGIKKALCYSLRRKVRVLATTEAA